MSKRELKNWVDSDGLSGPQLKALELLKYQPVSEVAREIDVTPTTIYRWLNSPESKFSLRLNEQSAAQLSATAMSWVEGFSEATQILRCAARGEQYNGADITSQQLKASQILTRHLPAILESVSLHVRINQLSEQLAALGFDTSELD